MGKSLEQLEQEIANMRIKNKAQAIEIDRLQTDNERIQHRSSIRKRELKKLNKIVELSAAHRTIATASKVLVKHSEKELEKANKLVADLELAREENTAFSA